MSVDAQRSLRSAISNRRFDPVYYLHGADDFRKDAAVAEICAAAVDAALRDFNVETLRGAETDAERLAVALGAVPMMSEHRVVVLRDVGALRKPAREILNSYVATPNADTVLVLTSPTGDAADAALASRTTSVAFDGLGDAEVTAWLSQRARKLGVEITPDAAALLASASGPDLAQGAGELDKLASYVGQGAIDVAAVEAVVGVRPGESAGSLLDAVAARDARRAVALVGRVLAQPKQGAVPLVAALTTQMLAIGVGRALLDSGTPFGRLKNEFFTLLKAGGGAPGRPWGEAVQCWTDNVKRWHVADIRHALDALLEADIALKETSASSDVKLVTTLVLSLCTPRSGRAAA